MEITREEIEILVRQVVSEAAKDACQAIRYAVKHQDFTDAHPEYRMGWIVGSKVCEDAIHPHMIRKQDNFAAIVEGFCKDHSLHNVRCGGTGGSSSDSTRDVIAGCLA